jgi:hypothetical protein
MRWTAPKACVRVATNGGLAVLSLPRHHESLGGRQAVLIVGTFSLAPDGPDSDPQMTQIGADAFRVSTPPRNLCLEIYGSSPKAARVSYSARGALAPGGSKESEPGGSEAL